VGVNAEGLAEAVDGHFRVAQVGGEVATFAESGSFISMLYLARRR
jgi:hypothetical protein